LYDGSNRTYNERLSFENANVFSLFVYINKYVFPEPNFVRKSKIKLSRFKKKRRFQPYSRQYFTVPGPCVLFPLGLRDRPILCNLFPISTPIISKKNVLYGSIRTNSSSEFLLRRIRLRVVVHFIRVKTVRVENSTIFRRQKRDTSDKYAAHRNDRVATLVAGNYTTPCEPLSEYAYKWELRKLIFFFVHLGTVFLSVVRRIKNYALLVYYIYFIYLPFGLSTSDLGTRPT